MSKRFNDRHAIVFGAGALHGIGNGSAAATLFAREGARVTLVDRDQAAVDACLKLINDEGLSGLSVTADVTRTEEIHAAIHTSEDEFGPIDILHNNVGILRQGGVIAETEEDWSLVLDTNLTSAFRTMKQVLPGMVKRQSGVIVNVSSTAAVRYTGYDYAGYSASKAALNQLTVVTALQHAADGVRVNAVMPGLVDTAMVRQQLGALYDDEETLIAERAEKSPIKRMVSPWDVAEAALFLASDAASQITGHCIPVDGGLSMQVGIKPRTSHEEPV